MSMRKLNAAAWGKPFFGIALVALLTFALLYLASHWSDKAVRSDASNQIAKAPLETLELDKVRANSIAGDTEAKAAIEALDELTRQANAGSLEAQHSLGSRYLLGPDFKADAKIAAMWFSKAAASGYRSSQYTLGMLYLEGNGVAQDFSMAGKWFLEAANQGSPGAQYKLGEIYLQGTGVEKDLIEAHKWFNLSAASGFNQAKRRRDEIAIGMSKSQIAVAQQRARTWRPVQPYIEGRAF